MLGYRKPLSKAVIILDKLSRNEREEEAKHCDKNYS